MSRALVLLVLLLGSVTVYGEDKVAEEVLVSPKSTFKIVQHYDDHWTQVLQFTHVSLRSVRLEEGISWPASYFVSPDEQWVLRIQKSGSGDNISWL